MYAARERDEVVRVSADILCQSLRRKLSGARPTNAYYKQVTALGAQVAEGKFPGLDQITPDEILQKY